MKRIFLSAAFAMGVMVAAAQTGGAKPSENTKIVRSNKAYLSVVSTNDEIRHIATQMQLNEGQYIRFRDLSRARNEQIKEINNMYANDAAMRQSKLMAANQEFEKQLAQTISQSQFNEYLASQGRAPEPAPGSIHQAVGYGGRSMEGGAATGTSNNGGAVSSDEVINISTSGDKGNMEYQPAGDENKSKAAKKEGRRGKMKKEHKDKDSKMEE
jgi:uncharacterized protein YdbL (DUF1318 family)